MTLKLPPIANQGTVSYITLYKECLRNHKMGDAKDLDKIYKEGNSKSIFKKIFRIR